nr:hypothetical protein CFP56_13009 [Quercus suber]
MPLSARQELPSEFGYGASKDSMVTCSLAGMLACLLTVLASKASAKAKRGGNAWKLLGSRGRLSCQCLTQACRGRPVVSRLRGESARWRQTGRLEARGASVAISRRQASGHEAYGLEAVLLAHREATAVVDVGCVRGHLPVMVTAAEFRVV